MDGVIALNQWAVEELLSAIGPVPLPSQTALEPSSFMDVLEQTTDAFGRGYLGTVMDSLLDRFREQGSRRDMLSLLVALNRSLGEKEILLNFHDADLQTMARTNGWDGSLASMPGDFLMVVDSNVGFSKVNRNIEQSIAYQVDLDPSGSAKARLDLVYTNRSVGALRNACSIQSSDRAGPSYEQLKNSCYWDYLRVYVPEGSTFALSTPFPMPDGALYRTIGYNDVEDTFKSYRESGRQVFAGLFKLAPGESRSIAFVYELPQGAIVRDGGLLTYNLTVQKQSGKRSTPVEVVVRMPEGYSLRKATPSPSSVEERVATFSLVLDNDVELRIEFAQ